MEVSYKVGEYFQGGYARALEGIGKPSAQEEQGGKAAPSGDRVEISQEGRALQRILSGAEETREEGSGLNEQSGGQTGERPGERPGERVDPMDRLSGRKDDGDTRLAYNDATSGAGGSDEDEDAQARIRELQEQLRAAMKRLQQARNELTEAQAQAVSEVKAMQQGEDAAAALNPARQQAEQEQSVAQQKVAAAQAEVNSVQEQLQKLLHGEAQQAGQGSSGGGGFGQSWEPQGTNDYIRGTW